MAGKPVPQPRPKVYMAGKHPRVVSNTKKVKAWKDAVAYAAASQAPGTLPEGPMYVGMLFLMPRRKDAPKTIRLGRQPMVERPDLDNLAKAVKNALTGITWKDDSQVVQMRVHKERAAADEAPGVWIEVRPL